VNEKKRKNLLLLPGIEAWIVQSTWSETQLVIKKEIHLNSINLRKILLHDLSQIIRMSVSQNQLISLYARAVMDKELHFGRQYNLS